MVSLKLFYSLFFVPLLAPAAAVDSIVKIKSFYSTTSLQPRLGTGIVVQWRGHKYVLTSDHVIYHSNRSFTHQISDSKGHTDSLQYFVADAGRGLALLSFKDGPNSFESFDFETVGLQHPSLFESITMMGFPADSDTVLVDQKGKLSNLKFSSDIFVELSQLMEVSSGHAEFGMSGGAAFSAEGVYRGLLSHQFVAQNLDTTLLIPAEVVRNWLESIWDPSGLLVSPSPIELFLDPAQQVSDFPSFRTSNLYIAFSEVFGNGVWGIQPITSKTIATETIYGGSNGNLAKVSIELTTRFLCMGFRRKEVLGSYAASPNKLNLWMRALKNPQIEPLWTISGKDHVVNVRKARAYQKDFEALLGKIGSGQAPQLSQYVMKIAELLIFYPSVNPSEQTHDELGLGNWRYIKPKDLDYILDAPALAAEWAAIEPELKVPLRQKLIELQIIMRNLTL